jgi:hypothetical protein
MLPLVSAGMRRVSALPAVPKQARAYPRAIKVALANRAGRGWSVVWAQRNALPSPQSRCLNGEVEDGSSAGVSFAAMDTSNGDAHFAACFGAVARSALVPTITVGAI